MMSIKLFFKVLPVFMIVAVGCSSTSKQDVSSSNVAPKSVEEYVSGLDNKDFIKPLPVKFDPHEDQYVQGAEDWDSLAKETIARTPQARIETIAKEGPVAQIASLCYQGKYLDGYKLGDSLYSKYKSHPGYWNQLGTCYLLQKNWRKAQLFYNKSLDVNKNYAPAINNLGVIYQNEGRDQKAIEAYKKSAEVNAFSITPMFNLGHLYLKYGLVGDAQKIFLSLHSYNRKDPDVLNGLANCYFLNGELVNAIKTFSAIEKKFWSRADIGINYALALKFYGRVGDAKTVFAHIDSGKLGGLSDYYAKASRYLGE